LSPAPLFQDKSKVTMKDLVGAVEGMSGYVDLLAKAQEAQGERTEKQGRKIDKLGEYMREALQGDATDPESKPGAIGRIASQNARIKVLESVTCPGFSDRKRLWGALGILLGLVVVLFKFCITGGWTF